MARFFKIFRVFGLAMAMLGVASAQQTVRMPLADGFDQPVGKPNAEGYYMARGVRLSPPVHYGEDWNGRGGGPAGRRT